MSSILPKAQFVSEKRRNFSASDGRSWLSAVDMGPAAAADDSGLSESWVELAKPPSRGGSLCSSSVDAFLLLEAQRSNEPSRHSPKSLHSPNIEFNMDLESVKQKLARDMLAPVKNGDWDWSSRPEASSSQRSGAATVRRTVGEPLTTPPNSPTPDNGDPPSSALSLRHSALLRSVNLAGGAELLFGLLVSNIVTFILGACIGFCICRKLLEAGRR